MSAPEVRLTYQVSLEEFLDAYEEHWRRERVGTRNLVIVAIIVGFLAAAIYALGMPWVGGFAAVVAVFALSLVFVRRRMYRRFYREAQKFHGQTTATFRDGGIEVESPVGHSELEWSTYHDWHETGAAFLLYMTRHSFSIIPRHAFPDAAAQDTFRSLLTSHLGPA